MRAVTALWKGVKRAAGARRSKEVFACWSYRAGAGLPRNRPYIGLTIRPTAAPLARWRRLWFQIVEIRACTFGRSSPSRPSALCVRFHRGASRRAAHPHCRSVPAEVLRKDQAAGAIRHHHRLFKKVPCSNSSNACRSCSCVFITIGPYQATGSCSGSPEHSKNRMPSSPA